MKANKTPIIILTNQVTNFAVEETTLVATTPLDTEATTATLGTSVSITPIEINTLGNCLNITSQIFFKIFDINQ